MSSPMLNLNAEIVYVVPPSTPTVVAAPPSSSAAPVVVVVGPQGAIGPQGEAAIQWLHGDGPPPTTIVGSHPGDYYVDDLTGLYYQQS